MRYYLPLILSLMSFDSMAGTVTQDIRYAANKAGVPGRLLYGICKVESGLNPNAWNKYDGNSPSHGLCQIKFETAKWLGFKGKIKELYIPRINAYYAAKYLKYQLVRYDADIRKAISAYNAGRATTWNAKYVNKVLRMCLYERL